MSEEDDAKAVPCGDRSVAQRIADLLDLMTEQAGPEKFGTAQNVVTLACGCLGSLRDADGEPKYSIKETSDTEFNLKDGNLYPFINKITEVTDLEKMSITPVGRNREDTEISVGTMKILATKATAEASYERAHLHMYNLATIKAQKIVAQVIFLLGREKIMLPNIPLSDVPLNLTFAEGYEEDMKMLMEAEVLAEKIAPGLLKQALMEHRKEEELEKKKVEKDG